MIRLLLVDDHPVVRSGYQRLLEQGGETTVVAHAACADEAVARFAEQAPDLTITDLAMPGSGGLELIRRLRERRADARVIVFSMHDGAMLVRRALDLGARGFVSKTADPDALLDAVRCVAAGGRYLGAELAGAVDAPPAFDTLTDREFEVFRLLARGESAAACARSLHLSPKTVANHQSTIRDKLGVATRRRWRTWRSGTASSRPSSVDRPGAVAREVFPGAAPAACVRWSHCGFAARRGTRSPMPIPMPMPTRRVAFRATPVAFGTALLFATVGARAQAELPRVEVVAPGPLPGVGLPRDEVPANVQTATGADIERRHALDLSSFLGRTLGSVNLNETQGNPFQPDLNFRGYTASPLLGTPQGLSVFLDGVRLNQPFGDVVSWDLIPRSAIASVTLMPGSNPLFGLNTLGGALAVQTKDGRHDPGTSVQVLGGQRGRAAVEFETGGSRAGGLDWFVTGNRFREHGWRRDSPSDVAQLFGKLGATVAGTDLGLTAAVADNDLTGNGVQEQAALQRDHRSSYTVPDETRNRSAFVNLAVSRKFGDGVTVSGNAYYRRIVTHTYNGDANDDAFEESIYQPSAAERAALAAAGYTGVPASGATAANTPFPKWRCIANVLLNTEPNEKCDGLVNRSSTRQQNHGATLQLATETGWGGVTHQLLGGIAYDASRVRFAQGTQFGYIEPDRSVTAVAGPGAFSDGTQDSENAFDARVDLASRSRTVSAFASDTVALNARTFLTVAGRYNRNTVSTVDAITPGGGPGSLDGSHRYARFNPAVGLSFAALPSLTAYAGWNQGARAPTAIELGCADPATPCKLPNAFAGDPPLKQVVTTTVEAGLRGGAGTAFGWNVGIFRSDNKDDLLFVADNASGYGYFRNFGQTRRQGLEAGLSARPVQAVTVSANLTFLDATYRSAEVVDGSANSSNASAAAGFPGTEGTIRISPGDRIPLLPRRLLKLSADWQATSAWRLGADLNATSGANARGNENGQHRPDGTYYTGPGRSAGYAVVNLNVDYRPSPRWKFFLQVDNLLDRRFASAAQLGANGFDANGSVIARAFPADANGDRPVARGTFLAPGAPRTAWIGVRYAFAD